MIRYITLFAFLSIHFTILSQDYHPTKLFVKFKESTSLANIDYTVPKSFSNVPLSPLQKTFVNFQVNSVVKTSKIKKEAFQRIYTLSVADSLKLKQLILELKKLPEIELVERIPVYQAFYTPNDLHPNQWHLPQINALQAWDISTGSTAITVAIVDDAVKTDHEDLQNNIWVNPGEIPNNGIDDDNNGYTDDVNGFDVADWDNDPRPPSFANNSVFTHGTHCAGIAAAVSNNGKGIASIGYSVKIIPVKTKLSSTSDGTLTATYDGVEYAINAGARVISMSWGGGGYSSIFQSLFDYAHAQGIVLVAAAGNSSSSAPFYPAAYNNVIAVGATDNTDHVAYFSNYGTTIDIMAPGVNIWSTLAGSTSSYGYLSGTSMACPLVAGSAALILSSKPTLLPLSLENCIKNSADNINALNPAYIGLMGGGRINVYNAIRCASSSIYADFTANNTTICGGASVTFTDLTVGSITGWNWSFPGGNPSSSTLKNPVVTYPTIGTYAVSLTAYNDTVSGSITKTAYIHVYKPGATLSGNNTIVAGNIAYLKIDFNGVAPFSFSISDGSTTINQSNAYSNPYYLFVSPNSTKTYTLTAFSDNNCSGTFTGSAIITVTTASGNNPTVCPTTDGLIAYYPFLGNANDGSGNGNNSSSYNSSFAAIGKDGISASALSFDGTNLLPVNNTLGNFGTADFSCSFWFNAASLKTMNRFMSKRVSPSWDNYFSFEIYNGKLVSELSESLTRYYQISGTTAINANTWYHAVFLRRNNELFIYLNGQKETTSIDAGILQSIDINNSYDFLFGNAYQSAGSPFTNQGLSGRLDEVRIYNRALSDCEIAQLYDCNNTCIVPGTCIPSTGLIGSYLFNGNALDASLSSNNGTVVGAILTTDRFGSPNSAYNFSGGTSVNPQYIYFSNDQLKKVNGDQLSISVWVKITGDGINSGRIFLGGTANAQYGVYKEDASDDRIFLRPVLQGQGQNFGQVHTRNNLSRNTWHHIVAMYDGSKTMIYVDGQLNNSTTGVSGLLATNTETSLTGGETLPHSAYLASVFDGSTDDINIYNRVLSDCEIAKLYDCNAVCGTSQTCGSTNGLIAYYPFNGNTIDATGNGATGTIMGTGISLTTDRFGNSNSAYDFNGTPQQSIISPMNLRSIIGISLWFKASSSNINPYPTFYILDDDFTLNTLDITPGYFYSTLITNSGLDDLFARVDKIGDDIYATSKVSNDVWHHYYCSYDGPNKILKLYLDGFLIGTKNLTIPGINLNNNYLRLGKSSTIGNDNDQFMGQIDEVRIYNRVLSDCEVAQLYNCSITCGLVASYPFCGNANDVSGNGNNGTVSGAILTSDRFGNTNSAYDFNGTSSYIYVSNSSSLNITTGATLSAWVKLRTKNNANQRIVNKITQGTEDGYLIDVGSYYPYTLRYLGGNQSTYQYISSNSVTYDVWHHIAATDDGQFIKLYIDGALNASYTAQSSTINTNPLELLIGASSNFDVNYFVNGVIDDVKIYNRALSDTEIITLYNEPALCTTSGIVANYPFCGNPNDITANQLNGTISGNVTLQPDRFNIPNTSYNFGGGTNDVILVNNKSNLLTLQNFSVSFWIKRSRTNTKEDLFLSTLGGGWGLYINNGNNLSFTQVDWNQAYSNFTLNDLNWHHCAVVSTNSQTTFYLDGVNSITQPYPRTIIGASLYSFGNRYGTNEGFQGQLDDFKIYSKLLTDEEVLALFNEEPPCNDDPIAFYPFCGNTSDVIGSNNGTLTGATLTTDRFGNTNSAYYFDGSDYIRINRNISQDFSISFWFKTTILGGNCGTSNTQWHCGLGLIDADRSDCRDDFGTSINNGRVDFGIGSAICGDERYLATPGQFNDNTWHHVVAVRSISGFTRLYVDNVLLSSSTSNNRSLTDPKRITFGGMENTYVGEDVIINYFIGYLDDIKIYDRVISQQEINTLYNAPAPCTSPCTLSITGNNTGCLTQNSIYSVFPSNLNNITWTVTGGSFTKLSGNTISVNWTSPGTNMIIARETVCGITFSLPVNVTCCINISSINISGPSTGCLKDSLSSNIYEIDGALPYNFQWIVTGGTFRQIAPNAISVIWTSKGANSISASQTICGIIKSKPVFVSCCNASSTSILGSAIVCKDSSYIYQTSNVSVSDVYNWTISGGNLTKLNNYSAKVVWNSIGNRSIYAYEGQCQTAASLDVTVNLCGNQPRTITGANSGCYNSNLTYKVTNTTNSSTFAWIVIGGGYVPSGNNSIIVNWTSIGHNFVSAIDLSSGKTYTFSVNINCCSNNVPADALPPISVDFSELDMICNTVGTVALKGGSPPGGFYWYQGIASNYLVVSKGGDFPLTYQYTDQYQCTNTVAGVLSVKLCTVPGPCDMAVPPCTCPGYTCPPPFKIYSAITPNGDQFNDYWVMDSLPPDLKVSIMDRWGNLLFHDDHYFNNWDGRSSDGEKLPSGIYYYIVEFEPGKRRYTGTISIIRD